MSLPTITLFDTLTSSRKKLETIEPGKISMYCCGVTTYDYPHIGHGRTFISFDIVVRYLRHRGYDVKYVRNHTDIDDKIINRANAVGEDPFALSQRFVDAFDEDMAALGCVPVDVAPKVTEHIPHIIDLTQKLIDKSKAYPVDGDVYYDVTSFEGYGKLSGRTLDDMRAGERVAVDERKKHPGDFALWKAAKPGEPFWQSPWGPGRPGWHIECSAMSCTYLGENFDIHGGGADLQFPHHENEIAQSEGAHDCQFANNWMHVAMLNVDGEKMSKSLGNFWTIRDVLQKHHAEAIRFFMMSAHYRKQVNYSHINLEIARERVQYFYGTLEAIAQLREKTELPAADPAALQAWLDRVHQAMDDDFNTPQLSAVLNDAAREANELLKTKKIASKTDVLAKIAAIEELFRVQSTFTGVCGSDPTLVLTQIRDLLAVTYDVDHAWVEERIVARNAAREAKDWAQADVIRDELAAKHVVLMDSATGTQWRIQPPSVEA